MARRLATAVLTLGCMHASVVAALGLGELRLESFLNEPLSATVDVHSATGLHEDQIRVRLATAEDFEKLGIDRAYFLTSIKFEVSIDERGNGKIMITSEDPVLEPYLDFLVEARWPTGRLLREYTVLVDPPTFDSESRIVSASQKVMETEGGEDTAKKSPTAGASSGTAVKTGKSDLAAGQMPQRDYGSSASSTPLAGDQYMIRRDETLWGIALKSKPEGTSVHQTMLDIQRMNPKAFINGNINRIKAGYIIALPASGDISSDDLESARREVQQQNQDWRDGVDRSSSGPSLRISADPSPEETPIETDASRPVSSNATANENLEEAERERTDLIGRLAAMEEQVETLQHIVSLKDDQISVLQNALADSDTTGAADLPSSEPADSGGDTGEAVQTTPASPEPEPIVAEKPAAPAPAKAPAPVAEEGIGTLTYILGLLVAAAVAGFFFWRRRSGEDAEEAASEAMSRDVFADVKMPDSDVQLNDIDDRTEPLFDDSDTELDLSEELEPEAELEPESESEPDRRGYGAGKNDEYATDEAGDALAEADIYIAYGRYPQAVDLLKTAIGHDPANAAYRLKLIELSAQMGNKEEAQLQYSKLQANGDSSAIARADEILGGAGNSGDWAAGAAGAASAETATEGLELVQDLDLTADTGEVLEADFGELEIEPSGVDLLDDDLDLSADFSDEGLDEELDGEELVFAEGGNEMSTKLDLARAYLDMGDEDGARQILEEVTVEGSTGQQEEAKILLERLD